MHRQNDRNNYEKYLAAEDKYDINATTIANLGKLLQSMSSDYTKLKKEYEKNLVI